MTTDSDNNLNQKESTMKGNYCGGKGKPKSKGTGAGKTSKKTGKSTKKKY